MINAIRSHLAEFGIVAPVGRNGVEQLLGIVADANEKRLPEVARACVAALQRCTMRRSKGGQVKIEKEVLLAAVEPDRQSGGLFSTALTQQKIAETQNASAGKLIVLAEKLEADAISLTGEIEMAAQREGPIMETNNVAKVVPILSATNVAA